MKRQRKHRSISPRVRRYALIGGGAVVALFVLVNTGLGIAYHNRTYPHTKVMSTDIGSVSYSNLSQKVSDLKLLPENLDITKDTRKITVSLSSLGISKDVSRTTGSANKERSWLPLANLWKSPELKAPIRLDDAALTRKAAELDTTFKQAPADAYLTITGATVGIAESIPGYAFDAPSFKQSLVAQLDAGDTKLQAPTKTINPVVAAKDLSDDKQLLEKQLSTPVTYKFESKTRQVKPDEMAKWYARSGNTYAVSTAAVSSFISQVGTEFGIRIKGVNQLAESTKQGLEANKAVSLTFTQQTASKTFTYCTAVKGVDPSNLAGLKSRLQSTYADPRGWSLNGLVEFKEVSSGCNFTVWLTEASLMPTFGAICDSMWSCRVGPNVVINFDRWQNASPAWQQYGGTLEDYRHMVINHESGHWLGFGHRQCPGTGQLAPVMQQQSIDLQGCKFNPWPAADELQSLKSSLGV